MDSRVVTTKLRLPKPVVDLAGRAVGEILVAQGVVSREKVDEAALPVPATTSRTPPGCVMR